MKNTKEMKTIEQRLTEAVYMRRQFVDLGLPEDTPGYSQVFEELREFVKNGHGATKRIRLPDLGYSVHLMLSMQPHVTSYMTLRKDPGPNTIKFIETRT
jgi:hypothetical protein